MNTISSDSILACWIGLFEYVDHVSMIAGEHLVDMAGASRGGVWRRRGRRRRRLILLDERTRDERSWLQPAQLLWWTFKDVMWQRWGPRTCIKTNSDISLKSPEKEYELRHRNQCVYIHSQGTQRRRDSSCIHSQATWCMFKAATMWPKM